MASNPRPTKRTRRSVSHQGGPSDVSEAGPSTAPSANGGRGYEPQAGAFEQGSSAWSHDNSLAAEGPIQGVSGFGIHATSTTQPPLVNTAPYPMNDYRPSSQAGYHLRMPMLSENEHQIQYRLQPTHGSSLSFQQFLMLDSRGPYATSQGLPHSYVTDALVQTQGVPAAGSTSPSVIDPSLRATEPWSHFRAPFVQDPIGQTSGSTSRKRKADDEDAEEDDSAYFSAQHEQERTTKVPARVKGKGKARHTDPDSAEGAGPSTPPLTLLPAHSNQERDKKKDYALKSRAHNSASRLILNDLLCTDHKVHYKLGGSKKPEKEVLENAIACFTDVKQEHDQLAIFLHGRTQYALKLEEENVHLGREREQLEESHRSLSEILRVTVDECDKLRVDQRKRKGDVAVLSEEVETLKKKVEELNQEVHFLKHL